MAQEKAHNAQETKAQLKEQAAQERLKKETDYWAKRKDKDIPLAKVLAMNVPTFLRESRLKAAGYPTKSDRLGGWDR